MSQKYYMFITDSPDNFTVESYTKYVTTVDSFCGMLTDPEFFEDTLGMDFQEIQQFSLTPPDDRGNIRCLLQGLMA